MFKVGDRVFDIMRQKWGVVKMVSSTGDGGISVCFEDETYWNKYDRDGVMYGGFKVPSLSFKEFYFPDDLQERPKWRAAYNENYYYINSSGKVCVSQECSISSDSDRCDVGNYFKTIEEAKESKFYKVFHDEEVK